MKRIDELSRDTLHNYVRKAADDLAYSSDKREDQKKREFVTPGMEKVRKHMVARTSKKIVQRAKGIHMATDKITKEDVIDEANYNHGFGDSEKRNPVMPYKIHGKHQHEFMHVYKNKLGNNNTSHAKSLAYNHALRHISKHGDEVRDAFEKYYKHSNLAGHTGMSERKEEENSMIDEAGFSNKFSPLKKTKPETGYMRVKDGMAFSSSNPDMRINRRAGMDKDIDWNDDGKGARDKQQRQMSKFKEKAKLRKEDEEDMDDFQLDESTRKHFQAAAATIKAIEDPEKRKEHANVHADIYAKQNPRFDRSKFLKAAGVNEDEEIEDEDIVEDEDEISAAEAIVNAAVFETPVDLKDTFSATIGDRIASRIGEIRDGMREKVFAPRQEEVETDDDKKKVDEGHSINQLKQAADHHRLHKNALQKQYMSDTKYGNNEKDIEKAGKHNKARMVADKLRGKLQDAGKSHTSQLKKEEVEELSEMTLNLMPVEDRMKYHKLMSAHHIELADKARGFGAAKGNREHWDSIALMHVKKAAHHDKAIDFLKPTKRKAK